LSYGDFKVILFFVYYIIYVMYDMILCVIWYCSEYATALWCMWYKLVVLKIKFLELVDCWIEENCDYCCCDKCGLWISYDSLFLTIEYHLCLSCQFVLYCACSEGVAVGSKQVSVYQLFQEENIGDIWCLTNAAWSALKYLEPCVCIARSVLCDWK